MLISDSRGSKCILLSNYNNLELTYSYRIKNNEKKNKSLVVNTFIHKKGWKAIGKMIDNKKRMSSFKFIHMKNHNKEENKENDINDELTLFN